MSVGWVVLTVSLVFCFGPKLKFLVWNLDQAEQLSTCVCTSFCFCHLFIDPCWGRMYFFLYEFIYNILLYFISLFFPLSNLINFFLWNFFFFFILIKYDIWTKFQTFNLKIVYFIGKKVKNLKKKTHFFPKNHMSIVLKL